MICGLKERMSLKPKRVDFNQTWHELQETVKGVITLANIPRAIWNDRFRYLKMKLYLIVEKHEKIY